MPDRSSMSVPSQRSPTDSMQPIRGGDLGGATDRERPVERFAIVGEQESRLAARGGAAKMGFFTNSGLQSEENSSRSLPFERLNRVNLSYGVVSGHFLA